MELIVLSLDCSISKGAGIHDVKFWKDYGVVCPTLWTTNGSFSYVARMLVDYYLSPRGYKIINHLFGQNVDFSSVQSVFDFLSREYKKWNV